VACTFDDAIRMKAAEERNRLMISALNYAFLKAYLLGFNGKCDARRGKRRPFF
jgi:hypothetical protein